MMITLSARTIVGRSAACLIVIDDPRASAEHAAIAWSGERWEVRDLGSLNGTWLDGRRLAVGEHAPAHHNSRLAFGGVDAWILADDRPVGPAARNEVTSELVHSTSGILVTIANNNYGADGSVSETARGGGVYLESHSSATFTNSIFANNGSEPLFGDPTCSIAVSYSISHPSCSGTRSCTIGAGVFEPASVEFVDEAANDYHEKSTTGHFSRGTWVIDSVSSPAIDKADPAASAAHEPAPNGARANLGAFGQTAEASKSP